MNFLKNLFGGGGRSSDSGDRGMYFYVRPKRCNEIVRVRIDPSNDLSQDDDGRGYFVRKTAQATRCPFPAQLFIQFDGSRRLTSSTVEDGELVSEADYLAWMEVKQNS